MESSFYRGLGSLYALIDFRRCPIAFEHGYVVKLFPFLSRHGHLLRPDPPPIYLRLKSMSVR